MLKKIQNKKKKSKLKLNNKKKKSELRDVRCLK
jgi:hypothetical protein